MVRPSGVRLPCQQLQPHPSLRWTLAALGGDSADTRRRPGSTLFLLAPCRAPWGWLPVASSAPPFQSLRIFSHGGSGEAKGLWSPNPPGASTPIKSVHPPSSPPDPLRLSPPPLRLLLSLASQKARFFKAHVNAVSSKKPSRRPRQLRSELVPSAALSCRWCHSTPPPFPGIYGFRTHFPRPCWGGGAGG